MMIDNLVKLINLFIKSNNDSITIYLYIYNASLRKQKILIFLFGKLIRQILAALQNKKFGKLNKN